MKKIGIAFTITATILMLFLIFVTAVVYRVSAGYYSPAMFSNVYYNIVIIDVLCFVAGGFCLSYNKLKKRSEQTKSGLETGKSASQKTAPSQAAIRIKKPSVPDQISQPQWIQSLYLCENIHPLVRIRYMMGVILMAGTLLSIPFLADRLPPDYELACVLSVTVLFWIGVITWTTARTKIKLQRTTGFVITMDGFLYYLNIDPGIYQDSRLPITKLGRIIYNNKKLQRINEAERTQETFLNSKEAKEQIEECLNGNQTRGLFCITRMDAPHVLRRNISNVQIKFWHENLNCVEKIMLFKNNKGYEQILNVINKLDQKIDYREFEKNLRKNLL